MISIDGVRDEGGGQTLRSALTMSLLTGKPFHIRNIRERRDEPGLLRQHLTAVHAAAAISQAKVAGDELGSTELEFVPGTVKAGRYSFDIGSAGSIPLVIQMLMLPLMFAGRASQVTIIGATHKPHAPTFETLTTAYRGVLALMGGSFECNMVRASFSPSGGGIVRCTVHARSGGSLDPLDLAEPGKPDSISITAVTAALPTHIARRELNSIQTLLRLPPQALHFNKFPEEWGPGNFLAAELRFERHTEMVVSLGEKGLPSERVAEIAAERVRRLIDTEVPVGEFLADQLIIPCAYAPGSRFMTVAPTDHFWSNAAVVERFGVGRVRVEQAGRDRVVVSS